MRSFIMCSIQIKQNVVGRICSTHGNTEKFIYVLVGKSEGNRPLENLDVDRIPQQNGL
jgi:hypothetical protein